MGSAGRPRLRIHEWFFAHAAILAGVCLVPSLCALQDAHWRDFLHLVFLGSEADAK